VVCEVVAVDVMVVLPVVVGVEVAVVVSVGLKVGLAVGSAVGSAVGLAVGLALGFAVCPVAARVFGARCFEMSDTSLSRMQARRRSTHSSPPPLRIRAGAMAEEHPIPARGDHEDWHFSLRGVAEAEEYIRKRVVKIRGKEKWHGRWKYSAGKIYEEVSTARIRAGDPG